MQHDFSYPVTLTPDEEDGGFVVTFRDIPEAITQGEDRPDALAQAADALEEAVAGRIRNRDEIPVPSRPAKGQPMVPVPALTAAKAALCLALRRAGITPSSWPAVCGGSSPSWSRKGTSWNGRSGVGSGRPWVAMT